jgi:restriction system protein
MWPTLQALVQLGGSGSIQEINDQGIEFAHLSDDQLQVLHGNGPQTEVAYRFHWARSYLKAIGAVMNTSRGIWAITEYGRTLTHDDMAAIPSRVRALSKSRVNTEDDLPTDGDASVDVSVNSEDSVAEARGTFTSTDTESWTAFLLEALVGMSPASFERLCQRVLRESGFTKVEVTGKSGDGGIDGIGVLRVSLLSFHVFFQCKRYRGSVGASAIRDFRGAMVGRTDKGLLITTGVFTPDAKREATRDGAPVLDLIDGDAFCGILRELQLGVTTQLVEQVTVDSEWFQGL